MTLRATPSGGQIPRRTPRRCSVPPLDALTIIVRTEPMRKVPNLVAPLARLNFFQAQLQGPGRTANSRRASSPSTTLFFRLRRPPPRWRLRQPSATLGKVLLLFLAGSPGDHTQRVETLPAAPQPTVPLPCTEFKGGTSRLGRSAASWMAP